eukprot:353467-Chlamydomonas_euryale.AAC.4
MRHVVTFRVHAARAALAEARSQNTALALRQGVGRNSEVFGRAGHPIVWGSAQLGQGKGE